MYEEVAEEGNEEGRTQDARTTQQLNEAGKTSRKASSSIKTQRIRGLPVSTTETLVREWLENHEHFTTPNKATLDIVQLSLAERDISTVHATVTLKGLQPEITHFSGLIDGPSGSTASIDSHFRGLTVLYNGATGDKADAE